MHFPLHPETPAEGRSLADLFKDPRFLAPNLRCQQPLFTDLEPGQTGRTPTAVLSCYEIRDELSPFGGVRVETRHPAMLHLRAKGQEWFITAVTSQLIKQ